MADPSHRAYVHIPRRAAFKKSWKRVYVAVYVRNRHGVERFELHPSERDFELGRRAKVQTLDNCIEAHLPYCVKIAFSETKCVTLAVETEEEAKVLQDSLCRAAYPEDFGLNEPVYDVPWDCWSYLPTRVLLVGNDSSRLLGLPTGEYELMLKADLLLLIQNQVVQETIAYDAVTWFGYGSQCAAIETDRRSILEFKLAQPARLYERLRLNIRLKPDYVDRPNFMRQTYYGSYTPARQTIAPFIHQQPNTFQDFVPRSRGPGSVSSFGRESSIGSIADDSASLSSLGRRRSSSWRRLFRRDRPSADSVDEDYATNSNFYETSPGSEPDLRSIRRSKSFRSREAPPPLRNFNPQDQQALFNSSPLTPFSPMTRWSDSASLQLMGPVSNGTTPETGGHLLLPVTNAYGTLNQLHPQPQLQPQPQPHTAVQNDRAERLHRDVRHTQQAIASVLHSPHSPSQQAGKHQPTVPQEQKSQTAKPDLPLVFIPHDSGKSLNDRFSGGKAADKTEEPASRYGVPSNGYGYSSNKYGNPSNGYENPSKVYGTLTNGYGTPSNRYENPSYGYGNPSNGYGERPKPQPSSMQRQTPPIAAYHHMAPPTINRPAIESTSLSVETSQDSSSSWRAGGAESKQRPRVIPIQVGHTPAPFFSTDNNQLVNEAPESTNGIEQPQEPNGDDPSAGQNIHSRLETQSERSTVTRNYEKQPVEPEVADLIDLRPERPTQLVQPDRQPVAAANEARPEQHRADDTSSVANPRVQRNFIRQPFFYQHRLFEDQAQPQSPVESASATRERHVRLDAYNQRSPGVPLADSSVHVRINCFDNEPPSSQRSREVITDV